MLMKSVKLAVCAAALAAGFSVAATGGASAQSVMSECGKEWSAAKAAGTTKPTDTWNSYLAECRVRKASATTAAPAAAPAAANPLKPAAPAAAAATPAAPATGGFFAPKPAQPTPAATTTAAKPAAAPATGGRAAMLAREKTCGAEWRANKVQLQAQQPGITWPKYWSACNTRLKAAVQ